MNEPVKPNWPDLPPARGKHFLDISELDKPTLRLLLDTAHALKKARREGRTIPEDTALAGKSLLMIFEKHSTRTRVSFELAMRQLGGHAVYLNRGDLQMGRGESVADTARVLSRYADAIMLRCHAHATLLELAAYSDVPVINGLTGRSHPCQILADLMTIEEHIDSVEGKRIAWVGDGNNVLNSWMEVAGLLNFTLAIATPPDYHPASDIVGKMQQACAALDISHNPEAAVSGAAVVMADTWVSMGDTDQEKRLRDFAPYQVNAALMAKAAKDAIFLHCLPAHRGEEVTAEVIDGPQSVVFDEAENRLHAQKAVLLWALGVL